MAAFGLLLAGGFYLLLIDTTDLPELYALAGVALLAALAFEAAREMAFPEVALRPSWLLRSWRVLARVPVHLVLVSREAVLQVVQRKPARGSFRAVPYDGGGERPADTGRRALSEALGSLAPNTIVIGVDRERKLLLVHQLHRQGGRDELDPLRLG
jgi:multisubunit Na+/H+ antiporter MnhE subunit